jgi:catechol 2,3-dioxygenase-like lactoylglutathione lyase family enzyme
LVPAFGAVAGAYLLGITTWVIWRLVLDRRRGGTVDPADPDDPRIWFRTGTVRWLPESTDGPTPPAGSPLGLSLTLWRDVLGFGVTAASGPAGPSGTGGAPSLHVVLSAGGRRIELAPGPPGRYRAFDVKGMRLALMVDDLDAVLAAADDAGWHRTDPPVLGEFGGEGPRYGYLHDPSGATVELIQPA